ncbi:amidohydrolase family protein, partial [Kaarinaea lacus]
KAVSGDASAVPAAQVLRMATLGGAKALGLDDLIGSLEHGKAADMTAVNLTTLETQPLFNPVSQLVYAAGREHVTDVWVAGKHVLKDKVLTTLDQGTILKKAKQWGEKILAANSGQ